ncbi:MAG TPA: hypothetical protein VI566_09780 [Xanthomonadales bacterium]|nr:hypothetical protein [Xanthomonadales bacterium]
MESIKQTGKLALAAMLLGFGCPAFAGGYVELEGVFDADSRDLTNPWLPLPEGSQYVHVAETDDECIVSILDVLPPVGLATTEIKGVKIRTLWDREFIAEGECPVDLSAIKAGDPVESTFDWYAQDVDGNIWYFGEHSVATDHAECDHPTAGIDPIIGLEGCLDGSWEAGKDIWAGVDDPGVLEGIIMLADPQKGQFYFQEYWEGEAEDMGKILNFKAVDSEYLGPLNDCVVIKEWVPLSPGSIEHKYFCKDHGLVQVEGAAGGKTEWTYLVEVSP